MRETERSGDREEQAGIVRGAHTPRHLRREQDIEQRPRRVAVGTRFVLSIEQESASADALRDIDDLREVCDRRPVRICADYEGRTWRGIFAGRPQAPNQAPSQIKTVGQIRPEGNLYDRGARARRGGRFINEPDWVVPVIAHGGAQLAPSGNHAGQRPQDGTTHCAKSAPGGILGVDDIGAAGNCRLHLHRIANAYEESHRLVSYLGLHTEGSVSRRMEPRRK